MAAPMLIEKLSRRAMLARSALASALATAACSAASNADEASFDGLIFSGPDGALQQQAALAELFWAAYVRAEAEHDLLYEAQRRHPDSPRAPFDTPEAGAAWDRLAERFGIPALEARCQRLAALCDAATRAAFDHPARTLDGARAKLRLALTALKAEHRGSIDPVDYTHLDDILADLDRLVAEGTRPAAVGSFGSDSMRRSR